MKKGKTFKTWGEILKESSKHHENNTFKIIETKNKKQIEINNILESKRIYNRIKNLKYSTALKNNLIKIFEVLNFPAPDCMDEDPKKLKNKNLIKAVENWGHTLDLIAEFIERAQNLDKDKIRNLKNSLLNTKIKNIGRKKLIYLKDEQKKRINNNKINEVKRLLTLEELRQLKEI